MKKLIAIILLGAATISTSAFGWFGSECCGNEYAVEEVSSCCSQNECDECSGNGFWY